MQECWLVFYHSNSPMQKVLDKTFTHVSILSKNLDQWFTLNYNLENITCTMLDQSADNTLIEDLTKMRINKHIVYVKFKKVTYKKDLRHFLRLIIPKIFTCVEITKAFIGINKWYILTPKQLYNYLLKKGDKIDNIIKVKLIK